MITTGQPIAPDALKRLGEFDYGLGSNLNKHDRVSVLIPVCIEQGITEGRLICLALKLRGYSPRHVGMTLKNGASNVPPEHRWSKDADGHYRLP